jgi:hypothetical protein
VGVFARTFRCDSKAKALGEAPVETGTTNKDAKRNIDSFVVPTSVGVFSAPSGAIAKLKLWVRHRLKPELQTKTQSAILIRL